MTGIRATYNPDKHTLTYAWPDGTRSVFEDLTEDEARTKTGLSGIPLVVATPIVESADPFAGIVDVPTNDGWDGR